MMSMEQKQFWDQHGYIKLTDYLHFVQKQSLKKWCDEVQQWPETPGKWMQYFESTSANEHQLCRIENILRYHDGFSELARGARTLDLVTELMGEEGVLFKEKINFKLPGASGFAPHQDYPAFISFGQSFHITMMVAIDDSTLENGCLQLVKYPQRNTKILPMAKDNTISRQACEQLQWQSVPCKSGGVLLFDSFLPHYSEANNSSNSRRALFLTFNRKSDGGSKYDNYFADKRKNFPPECERLPGVDYSAGEAVYNVANPISNVVC